MLLMKSCGFSSLSSLSPQKSFVVSVMALSSSSSGVGVGGGAGGRDWGLIGIGLVGAGETEIGLSEMLGVDGRIKEVADEDGTVMFTLVIGMNLSFSSCSMFLTIVANVRPSHGC